MKSESTLYVKPYLDEADEIRYSSKFGTLGAHVSENGDLLIVVDYEYGSIVLGGHAKGHWVSFNNEG